jgi:hypothetical protein
MAAMKDIYAWLQASSNIAAVVAAIPSLVVVIKLYLDWRMKKRRLELRKLLLEIHKLTLEIESFKAAHAELKNHPVDIPNFDELAAIVPPYISAPLSHLSNHVKRITVTSFAAPLIRGALVTGQVLLFILLSGASDKFLLLFWHLRTEVPDGVTLTSVDR